MKPLNEAEMRAALDQAAARAAEIGRPVLIIHNRRWDHIWKGPWRVVERAGPEDAVIVRGVMPGDMRRPSDITDARTRPAPYDADAPLITARRAELPGYQEPSA